MGWQRSGIIRYITLVMISLVFNPTTRLRETFDGARFRPSRIGNMDDTKALCCKHIFDRVSGCGVRWVHTPAPSPKPNRYCKWSSAHPLFSRRTNEEIRVRQAPGQQMLFYGALVDGVKTCHTPGNIRLIRLTNKSVHEVSCFCRFDPTLFHRLQ